MPLKVLTRHITIDRTHTSCTGHDANGELVKGEDRTFKLIGLQQFDLSELGIINELLKMYIDRQNNNKSMGPSNS